jgi:CII-binding regulator of phage lambda lysogenization HflD
LLQQLNLWLQQKKYSEELTMAAAQMESLNSLYKCSCKVHQEMRKLKVLENNLKLKDQMQSLTTNLSSLNNVYGGMLSAMGKRVIVSNYIKKQLTN